MRRGGLRFHEPLIVCPFPGGILPDKGHTHMTPPPSGAPRDIDTRGDVPLTSLCAAVVIVEVVVLAALWFFSRYFGA